MRVNNLMWLLREHWSGDLKSMQSELGSLSRSFDSAGAYVDADVAELVHHAKRATLLCITEPRDAQMQNARVPRHEELSSSATGRGYRCADPQPDVRRAFADGTVDGCGRRGSLYAKVRCSGTRSRFSELRGAGSERLRLLYLRIPNIRTFLLC